MSLTQKDKRGIKIMVAFGSAIFLIHFISQIGKADPEIEYLREKSECGLAKDLKQPLTDRCKQILYR